MYTKKLYLLGNDEKIVKKAEKKSEKNRQEKSDVRFVARFKEKRMRKLKEKTFFSFRLF